MHVTRRNDGRWLARASLKPDPLTGKRSQPSATGRTRREAEERLRSKLGRPSSGTGGHTFGDAIDHWLALAPRSPTDASSAPARLKLVPDGLRRVRLVDLDPTHIETLYASLIAAGKAPATVRRLHGSLRSVGKMAARLRWWPENLIARAEPPAVPRAKIAPPDAQSVARALGLDGVRLHDLRHFAASQLIAAGVDVVTVAARLGHASPTTTLAVYGHAVSAREREAADVAARVLGG